MPRRPPGHSLVEILATLAIASAVLTIALPAFGDTIRRARATSTMHLLSADLAMARGTAVMRRANVIACPTSPAGGGCGGDWSVGWRVFVDADGDLAPDAGLLLRDTTPPAPDRLRLDSSRPHLRYLPDGRSSHSNQTITVCGDGSLLGRVIVNNLGRIRSEREHAGTPCPHP